MNPLKWSMYALALMSICGISLLAYGFSAAQNSQIENQNQHSYQDSLGKNADIIIAGGVLCATATIVVVAYRIIRMNQEGCKKAQASVAPLRSILKKSPPLSDAPLPPSPSKLPLHVYRNTIDVGYQGPVIEYYFRKEVS